MRNSGMPRPNPKTRVVEPDSPEPCDLVFSEIAGRTAVLISTLALETRDDAQGASEVIADWLYAPTAGRWAALFDGLRGVGSAQAAARLLTQWYTFGPHSSFPMATKFVESSRVPSVEATDVYTDGIPLLSTTFVDFDGSSLSTTLCVLMPRIAPGRLAREMSEPEVIDIMPECAVNWVRLGGMRAMASYSQLAHAKRPGGPEFAPFVHQMLGLLSEDKQ